MTRFLVSLVVIALSCRGADDPLYGARPQPAPARRTAPAPRKQVVVDDYAQEQPPAPADAAPVPPADPVDEARARDEIAFESDYLRQKERLFADHAGRWIAIVGGRLLPADARGRVEPVASFDECVKAADAADSAALHRFLFRIGEEGDVVYADASAAPRNVVGTSLKSAFGIAASFDAGKRELRWTRGEKSVTFALDQERIELLLADPAGRQSMKTKLADSAGFGGFVALEATFAALLDTARHEIPGRVLLKNPGGAAAELRRARVRVKSPELGLDELVPVAAWPR